MKLIIKRKAKTKPMIQAEDEKGKIRWYKVEASVFEEIKDLNYNTEIDAKVAEDGDIPQIIGILNSNYKKEDEVKIEEVKEKLEERPPLEKELEEGYKSLSEKAETIEKLDKNLELKKLTAQTVQVLVGKVDLENIEEAITKIYNIYKNLK